MMSATNKLLIITVIAYFLSTTSPFTWQTKNSATHFDNWWSQSESLISKVDSDSINFVIEGRIDSETYYYKLSKTSGNEELFGRLVRLAQSGEFFETSSGFHENSIALRIMGNGESFERSFSKEAADANFKLKLLFKILAENQSITATTEFAKDENPQDKKGS
jgi:hypothetical protein